MEVSLLPLPPIFPKNPFFDSSQTALDSSVDDHSVKGEKKPFFKANAQLNTANAELTKMINKYTSRNALSCVRRLWQYFLLSAHERNQLALCYSKTSWFVNASLEYAKILEDLYEKNAKTESDLEYINKKQKKIYSLLDSNYKEENKSSIKKEVSEKNPDFIKKTDENIDTNYRGLLQRMDFFSTEELSNFEKKSDQSLTKEFFTSNKTEQFIGCIASLAGVVGFFMHFPVIALVITVSGLFLPVLRFIKLVLETRYSVKSTDAYVLDQKVIKPVIEGLNLVLQEIFPKLATTEVEKNKPQENQDTEKFQKCVNEIKEEIKEQIILSEENVIQNVRNSLHEFEAETKEEMKEEIEEKIIEKMKGEIKKQVKNENKKNIF